MAVKKFVKLDCEKGYIDNKDDINYYISTLMRKVAFGKMLGDFDENGLYVINSKIVEELIKMPKVIVEVLEEADLIRSKVKADAFFHFILSIEDNKAILKLLEKIPYQSNRDFNSGVYSNINEYVIDEVIIPDKDFDRNALYQKYNISTENDGDVLSIFDMDELSLALYYNIVEKLKINYLVQNELMLKEKDIENIEADYFEAMLELFKDYAEFGDKVTAGVKKDLAEKHSFVIVSKPFFQRTVNEILDSYIEDLSPEQREEVLNKIRAIKEQYYQKFKALIPIQIAQKAGVRFDANQVIQQGIIGELAQEIQTKGFASSDVRKILINESELQLSIAKIREMVKENEEICKRDNTKAKDITKGRNLTAKFYDELEKENKVDILKPDTTLIKSAIDEKTTTKTEQVKVDNGKKANVATATPGGAKKPANAVKAPAKKAAAQTKKPANTKQGQQAKKAQPAKKPAATKAQGAKTNNNTSLDGITISGSVGHVVANNQKAPNHFADEMMEDDNVSVRQSTKKAKEEVLVHLNAEEMIK